MMLAQSIDPVQIGAGLGVGGLIIALIVPWVLKTNTQLLSDAREDRKQLIGIIERNTSAFEQLKGAIADLSGKVKG